MASLIYLFFDYFLKKPKCTKNEEKKFHLKCRNSDPNNDKFFYQSNVDGVKGKSVTVIKLYENSGLDVFIYFN